MTKKQSIFISSLFALFLGGFLLVFLLSPARASSETENRTLAQRPVFHLDALFSGSYTKEMDLYLSDQFPLRDSWITLKSRMELLLGQREFHGVYLCGDTLISKVEEPDSAVQSQHLAYVNQLTEKTDLPVYLSLIPSAGEIWRDRLPEGAPSLDQQAFWQLAQSQTAALPVDVTQALLAHREEDIFYRTDHHWTSLGAYYGYTAMAEAMGLTPLPLDSFSPQTVTEAFYGTLYSTSGIRWLTPDSIQIYVPEGGLSVTSIENGVETPRPLYDQSYLERKDKYSMFLGGNQPFCLVENPAADGGTLLVVRDSYMDSALPFLAQHYSRIYLMDLRYYKSSVAQVAADCGADAILISYSIPNFLTDTNLAFLGQ